MPTRPTIHAARRLRQTANAPEASAWRALRALRRRGFPVRRQHPVGGYVVDFAIVRAKLAIEIDGAVHERTDVAARDLAREAYLKKLGWTVLHVGAEEALSADHLLARVSAELGL
ncbi:MAG: DUF559 domain-containing protein [Pseudomonadota bacterium]